MDDREELQAIFDAEGIDAEVREEIGAITASAEGEVVHILVIVVRQSGLNAWSGICGALAVLAGRKGTNRFNEFRRQRGMRIHNGETGADITEASPEALHALARPPEVPSHELEWRVNRQSWADHFDRDPE
jgi:hypothetical protein